MLKSRQRHSGFTLIELLIVVAIIGILAALLIPNLLDALQKSKQKRTLADMRITGTAMMSWLSDQSTAAAAGGTATNIVDMEVYMPITRDDLEQTLKPAYLQVVPERDGWKQDFEFYLNTARPSARYVMAIRSPGRDGAYDTEAYEPGSFDPTDYDRDIVWTDGFFLRWPQKTAP
jgi:type II secretion system protein G